MTLLQLQKKKAEAAAKVDAAQKAVAAAQTDAERATAGATYLAALGEKVAVNEELLAAMSGDASPQPAAKTTHYLEKHEKQKTVEDDEEEPEDEKKSEAPDDEKSKTDAAAPEDDEESKAILGEYAKVGASVAGKGPSASLYSPMSLLRAVKEATGAATLKGAFGALSAFGAKVQAAQKTEQRLATLETESKAAKVETLITEGKKSGKIAGKAHADKLRADGLAHGAEWLKSHLAVAPKVLNTTAEGFIPRADAAGNQLPEITPDMEKILAAATADKSPTEAAALRAAILATHQTTMNGAAKRPSH